MGSRSTAPKGTEASHERRPVERTSVHPAAIVSTASGVPPGAHAASEISGMDAQATRFLPPHGPMTSLRQLDTEGALDTPESACASGVHRIDMGGATLPLAPSQEGLPTDTAMSPLLEQVTLVIYGWKSVEPGILSWAFPSVGAALTAARAMTNAVRWAIVAGAPLSLDTTVDVARARASGNVICEQ